MENDRVIMLMIVTLTECAIAGTVIRAIFNQVQLL